LTPNHVHVTTHVGRLTPTAISIGSVKVSFMAEFGLLLDAPTLPTENCNAVKTEKYSYNEPSG
jgi:hypothetical protein